MKTMLIKQGKTNLKYLLIVVILVAIVGGGILWYMKEQIKFQENIIQASCNIDSECQFYCGCGCVLKNTPGCPSPNFACEYDSCNSCRCLNGQCISWSEVFIEAQQKKDINLCQEIENKECKEQCLEALTNLLEEDETADWKTYRNDEYGFEMKYPKEWHVEDNNIFNSKDPYEEDRLKKGVMKAQIQFHIDKSISSIQEYINKLVREEPESIIPNRIGDLIILELESDLNIIKFTGGPGDIGYVIPLKQDFSEVIYVIVWNPDLLFEKVISTFRFSEIPTELFRVTDIISITATTNKTEYEIFEEPIASIYNNSRKTINIFFQPEHLFRVERYINGEWEKLDTCISDVPVSQIHYGNEESSRLQNIRVRPFTTEKFNFCFCSIFNLKGSGINFWIEKDELFKPGKYRLVVPYSFEGLDVIQYIYSNEFRINNYKFNSPEFFCKYRYNNSEDMKSVYYSSFLNFDQDNEKELLVVCGDPGYYCYLYVLDNQGGEYEKVLLYREMVGQRHQFSDLKIIDIDKDSIDEIFFKESGWYLGGGTYSRVIYSPKHNEWFYFYNHWKVDIDSGERKDWTSYSSNLDLEKYKIFRDFLEVVVIDE